MTNSHKIADAIAQTNKTAAEAYRDSIWQRARINRMGNKELGEGSGSGDPRATARED